MNLSKLALILSFPTLMVGCSTLNQSAPSQALTSSVNVDFAADVEVGGITKGSSKTTILFGFIKLGDSKFADGVNYGTNKPLFGFSAAEDAKSAAAYKALKKSNADVLVAPRYTVDEFNFLHIFRTIDAEVTGYAGTIKAVKQK